MLFSKKDEILPVEQRGGEAGEAVWASLGRTWCGPVMPAKRNDALGSEMGAHEPSSAYYFNVYYVNRFN